VEQRQSSLFVLTSSPPLGLSPGCSEANKTFKFETFRPGRFPGSSLRDVFNRFGSRTVALLNRGFAVFRLIPSVIQGWYRAGAAGVLPGAHLRPKNGARQPNRMGRSLISAFNAQRGLWDAPGTSPVHGTVGLDLSAAPRMSP
jgi:hypothetical protein